MKRQFLSEIKKWNPKKILSVVGPTGCGKTETVLDCVRESFASYLKYPLLVSVDAVAAYKGLNIGSAKPLGQEQQDYSWEGLDLWFPDVKGTAMGFSKHCRGAIAKALHDDRPVILVGGSHFYERALVEGAGPGGPSDANFQKTLEPIETADLAKRLYAIDSKWQERVHANDRYRLKRFLDLSERQGLSCEDLSADSDDPLAAEIETLVLGLDIDADTYRQRLGIRIDDMMDDGWLEEINDLIENYGLEAPALQSVGYREGLAYLQEELSLENLESAILTSHLQLVKKQKTWLRGLLRR